jgi:hypothetical protein
VRRLKHGKHRKRKLGAHKSYRSPGIREWNNANLPPERPDWMDRPTYNALLAIRRHSEPAI